LNTTIKQLTARDLNEFTQMIRLFEDVFAMKDFQMPGENHLKKLLRSKNFVAFTAIDESAVVGGLTAHILPSYYSESAEIYIYDVAVKTNFQRTGIGKKLMQALTAYCRQNNNKIFFVQADEADIHALEFYQATGGSPQKVVNFNYLVE
jgi:aminoglycoside 3-N-acetyltransferase I